MTVSLDQLGHEWQNDPLGRNRALGGLRALSGFAYQLAVSLEQFIALTLDGHDDATLAFETLSDLSRASDQLIYLIQIKTTLSTGTARDVAEEAMAVDAFLASKHPELRDLFVYEVWCRRWESGDPRQITSERLGLGRDEARRWEAVRTRMREPVERSDPRLRLTITLFPIVRDASGLVAAMTGELLNRLGDGEPSTRIAEALLRLFDHARAEQTIDPPPRILDAEAFSPRPGDDRISLGQRPNVKQLAEGYFMARDERAKEIAEAVRKAMAVAAERDGVTVCWLSGGSGVGKSVLLLQALEQLVRQDGPVVHLLGPSDSALEKALAYWRSPDEQVVVAVDDLFAPARRGDEQWDRLSELATHPDRTGALVLLTAGPDTYLQSFKERASQTEAFVVNTLPVEVLRPAELDEYRGWFEHRTGTKAPPLDERLFVVAALLAVVGNDEDVSVEQFAQRFVVRAEAMGVKTSVISALAMNALGVPAPEALFEHHLDELEQLVDESAAVIDEDDHGRRTVTLFHQVVARELYGVLVQPHRIELRAQQLATAFAACHDDPALGAAILTGQRALSTVEEERDVLRRLLELTWERVREAAAKPEGLAFVPAWLFTATGRPPIIDLASGAFPGQLLHLFEQGIAGVVARPLAVVIHRHLPSHRPALIEHLHRWLTTNQDDPAWPDVVKWALEHGEPAETAERWLVDRVGVWGSVRVFTRLPDHNAFKLRVLPDMLDTAPTAKDEHLLWAFAQQHGVERDRLIDIVARRAMTAPVNRTTRHAARFLAATAGDAGAPRLEEALLRHIDEPALPRLLRAVANEATPHSTLADTIADVGIVLLERKPGADHWAATWHTMWLRSGPRHERLAVLARRWLIAHPGSPGWSVVAQAVAARNGRPTTPNWSQFFSAGHGQRDEALCRAARAHLEHDLDADGWSRLAQGLLSVDRSPETRAVAREWLRALPDHIGWPYVWRELCRRRPDMEDLELGKWWLETTKQNNRKIVSDRLRQVRRSRR